MKTLHKLPKKITMKMLPYFLDWLKNTNETEWNASSFGCVATEWFNECYIGDYHCYAITYIVISSSGAVFFKFTCSYDIIPFSKKLSKFFISINKKFRHQQTYTKKELTKLINQQLYTLRKGQK